MTILICPYCLTHKAEDAPGCCDESSAHFQEIELDFGDTSSRVNIYLPKQLLAAARSFDLNISEITRSAIRDALQNRDK